MTITRPTLTIACAIALVLGIPKATAVANQEGVTITFLANEGVMLSSGNSKVLIDALFLKYGRNFALPAESTQIALAGARAPFNDVDAILVTHWHGDHFHPAQVAAHMRANPRAVLLSSTQVIDSLAGRLTADERSSPRLMRRAAAIGSRRVEVIDGIRIEMLGIKHHTIEHLGYIVEIGGRRVLHLGDTDNFTEAQFAPFRLDTARIDVALVPMWGVTNADSRRVIERWIRPRQVVAFHVEEGGGARAERVIREAMPSAVTFSRPLERRTW